MVNPASPGSVRLLDQVRQRLRYLHYSLRTELAYVQWIRRYVLWSGKRHPREMGRAEVEVRHCSGTTPSPLDLLAAA